jgi:hypothetical protein
VRVRLNTTALSVQVVTEARVTWVVLGDSGCAYVIRSSAFKLPMDFWNYPSLDAREDESRKRSKKVQHSRMWRENGRV